MDEKDGPPSAKALDEGYNQTYLIMNADPADSESKSEDNHEVFFRCGNWCYKGQIQFGGVSLTTEQLPVVIPLLQKQQGSLRYYCNAKSVPPTSDYSEPLKFLEESSEFIAQEILSESIDHELRKMASIFPWIDDDNSSTYFELSLGSLPTYMNNVKMIASKTYTRGLIIIAIFYELSIYFIIQPGEGDQALLDVRFPDVSQHGQGLHLDSYNDHIVPYRKLTLWHVLGTTMHKKIPLDMPKIRTINVASKNYQQTYCILKSSWDNNTPTLTVHHDALFRFGSWCYAGRVQLTPALTLSDIPYVIPALRMQQSRLDFLCDVSQVPTTSPFAPALAYVQSITPLLEDQIRCSEDTLRDLVDRLTGMGLGDSVSRWLEGDPNNSFFEFKIAPDKAISDLLENKGESPLLDSRFPDVSGKGRGYQLQSYNEGDNEDWPALRKVSIWQTVNALEQEFREKADALAQSKVGAVTDSDSAKVVIGEADGSTSKLTAEDEAEEELVVVNHMRGGSSKETATVGLDEAESKVTGSGLSRPHNVLTTGSTDPETAVEMARAEDKNSPTARNIGDNGEKTGGVVDSSLNASMGGMSLNNNMTSPGAGKGLGSLKPMGGGGGGRLSALPHHVPKMEGLASKMEDIRRNMGDEGLRAPWDSKGKPLGSIGGGKESKK